MKGKETYKLQAVACDEDELIFQNTVNQVFQIKM